MERSWTETARRDLVNKVRNAYGYEDDDHSADEHINQLPPISRLRMILQWELGDKEWAGIVLGWAKGCGIEIGDYH